jgi:hypothetical protein
MNWQYRIVARAANFTIDKVKGDDLLAFPIEKARLQAVYIYIAIMSVTTVGYGWTLDQKAHYAVALVLQFFIGATITAIFNVSASTVGLQVWQ